jgi:hypothetical protein
MSPEAQKLQQAPLFTDEQAVRCARGDHLPLVTCQPMTAKSGAVYVDEICPACRMVVAWVSHGKDAWAAKRQAREVLEGR